MRNIFLHKTPIYNLQHIKFDLVAGLVLSLIAMPLCLGIAFASGAPLLSGLLSGVIGGIVVGTVSGSQVSVSGPAAGMAAVTLAAIVHLGDFDTFLLALMFASLLQVVIGIFRVGFIADYVPATVVQGLLCGVGILLIIKQLPLAFTLSSNLKQLQATLLNTAEGINFNPLYHFFQHINIGASVISCVSFAILLFFQKTKRPSLKNIPATIVVVIIGILINELFFVYDLPVAQDYRYLVNIPLHETLGDFFNQFQYPKWTAYTNPYVYFYALILALVSSLQSLLNIKAGERLDKKRRYCSKNRELIAQGIGNFAASLMGGIPVTSVILRTSINIQVDAKTKMATIFQGILLLVAMLFIPNWLNKIPLSCLAAILIFTGYKLTSPAIYKTIYQQGHERFIPFITTVLGIVFFDVLAGILIGLAVSLFYILKTNSSARLDIIKEIYPSGTTYRLLLPQQVTFLNKASLIAELNTIANQSQLIIDARYTSYIDKEIIELLREFQQEQAPHRQIALNLVGFKNDYDIHDYIDFINVTTYDVQSNLTSFDVLTLLQEGNLRFLNDTCVYRNSRVDIKHTALKQYPIAIVLGCIDSRVPIETIFDMSIGDLFCVRVAGNVVNDDILASIEYACHVVGAKLIVVLGHTRCGAIQAACDAVDIGHITQLLEKIKPAVCREHQTHIERHSKNQPFISRVTALNVLNTLQQIHQNSPILRTMVDKNDIRMVGAMYDVDCGRVNFTDYININNDALLSDSDNYINDKINQLVKNSNS